MRYYLAITTTTQLNASDKYIKQKKVDTKKQYFYIKF